MAGAEDKASSRFLAPVNVIWHEDLQYESEKGHNKGGFTSSYPSETIHITSITHRYECMCINTHFMDLCAFSVVTNDHGSMLHYYW